MTFKSKEDIYFNVEFYAFLYSIVIRGGKENCVKMLFVSK